MLITYVINRGTHIDEKMIYGPTSRDQFSRDFGYWV